MSTQKTSEAHAALVEAGMRLRAVSPDGWDAFTKALDAWAEAARDAMLQAPPNALTTAQGQAQGLTSLAAKMSKITEHWKALNAIAQHKQAATPAPNMPHHGRPYP